MSLTMKGLAELFKVTPELGANTRVKTPVMRVSYCFVHEPKETPNGDLKYSTCMIFNKDDMKDLRPIAQAIVNACAKKFGTDVNKWPKNLKCPLRDGDEERDNPEYENTYFLNAGNKNKPGIVGRDLKPIMDREEFYSGCYARASISFYPYDVQGNKGVGSGLNNLMFHAAGERLDGSVNAGDDFKEFAEEAKVEDAGDDNF